jgi:hypothetical protein
MLKSPIELASASDAFKDVESTFEMWVLHHDKKAE